MKDLLTYNDIVDIQSETQYFPAFQKTKEMIRREIKKFKNRCQIGINIPNDHIFLRILKDFTPPLDMDYETYKEVVFLQLREVLGVYGITSDDVKGKEYRNNLFKDNSTEIFLLTERDKYSYDTEFDLEIKKPIISCLETQDKTFSFHTFNRVSGFKEENLSVWSIDIPKLFLDYYVWYHDRLYIDPNVTPSYRKYLSTEIIPDMLKQYFDLVAFNRFMELYQYGKVENTDKIYNPLGLLDYSTELDKSYLFVCKILKTKHLHIREFLRLIPCIFSENSLETLKMRIGCQTSQSKWSFYLTRLRTIYFLLSNLSNLSLKRSSDVIFSLKRDFIALLNGTIDIFKFVPDDMERDYIYWINYLKSEIKINDRLRR